MVRLTEEAKEFIEKQPEISHRKLAEKVGLELALKVSHTTIANYRKNLAVAESVKNVKLPKVTPIQIVPTPRSRKKECPLSIDKVKKRLQANKDHHSYPYLNAQIFGGEYKGKNYTGKLQSDIRKLMEFLRDTE